uniref:NADH-ubiquinone oxidoreductase chain 4 n=1 Tax=Chouioia cunea TaxID=1570515 RepID=A0A8B0R623_9HYME|nr:NADH dehydrogenase subunit 4 [Chouioia cunea]QTW90618.1 NADH dehydrogenase subunit 4 [Chouioia cunea]
MMKFYLFLFMLILSMNFMKNMYLLIYSYLMLMIMLFMFLFINYNNNIMNIYNWLGMDNISYLLIILSIFIVAMMYLVSLNILMNKMFNLLLLILLISLMLSFNSINFFMFYFFFEISLIPTFILIMMYGYQPERLNAGMFMMLYTLFASLPLLYIIMLLNNNYNSLNYMYMYKLIYMNNFSSMMFYFFLIFAFLIKLPMFMFHMWLPKAHVEAPISGSMILAGVMLKLGGYGIIRSMNFLLKYSLKFNLIIMSLNLMGIIILSILCLRINDLKVIIAYSSVVHMSMMLMSMMTLYLYGKYSSLLLMVGHGLCSPGLFMLVNFFYLRTKSRNLYLSKGLMNYFPSMMLMWFLLCIGNMAAPITLNLIGELFIMMTLISFMNKIMLLLMIGMLLSAAYTLYMFSSVYHNNMNNSMMKLFNNKIVEFKALIMLCIPLNMLILKMELFY